MLGITLQAGRATVRRRLLAAAAALALLGCGGAADAPGTPVESTGSLTVALSGSSLSVVQTGMQSATATITRVGNVSGSVTVSVDGAPNGVTATANPSALSGSQATVQLTVSATAAAPVGTYTLIIRAHATTADASASMALTVTPLPSLRISLSPVAVSVPSGSSATANLAITRTALGAPVDITAGTLPSGLTVTALPAPVTGTSATLTIAASPGVPAGQYPVVIRATPSGSANLAVSVTLVITVPPGSSGTLLTWARCPFPIWVATQDGTGSWSQAVLTSGSVVFQVTATKASFAYVEGGKNLVVRTMAATELAGRVLDMCPPVAATKTIAGTDAHPPGPLASQHNFELGSAHAEIAPGGPANFSLTGVRDGTHDLVAWATGTSQADKLAIVRDLNLADGGSLDPIDMGTDGTNQILALATVTNPLASETFVFTQYYLTTSACTMNPIGTFTQPRGPSGVIHGVPVSIQRPTDFHMVSVLGIGAPFARTATLSYHTGGGVSIVMPSTLAAPSVTRLAGPYLRFTASFGDVSGEFDRSIELVASDGTNRIDISTTAAASGLSNVSLSVPDFSGVAGWSNTFAIASGASVGTTATATGGDSAALCSEGARTVSSVVAFQF